MSAIVESNTGTDDLDQQNKIEYQIESLLIGNRYFAELEREFDVFCPFEAFGVVRAEIRHSSYLAYIMNAYKPHGFGSRILRALLMSAAKAARESLPSYSEMSPLDVHLLELEQIDVRREWNRIDLLIVLGKQKVVIAIELKIDSTQHGDQLRRYRKTVEDNWPKSEFRHVYIFLTKFDEEPDDDEFWIPVRMRDFIEELDLVLETLNSDSDAPRLLRSYIQMLRRNHLSNPRLEDIARRLWSEHQEALDFLISRRPDTIADVMSMIGKDIGLIAKENSSELGKFVPDACTLTIARVAYAPWDQIPGFLSSRWTESRRLVLFEIKRESNKITGLVYLGPGTTGYRAILADALKGQRLHRPTAKAGEDWMCLAKTTLFELRDGTEPPDKDPVETVRGLFAVFLKQTVARFDPVIRATHAGLDVAIGSSPL